MTKQQEQELLEAAQEMLRFIKGLVEKKVIQEPHLLLTRWTTAVVDAIPEAPPD